MACFFSSWSSLRVVLYLRLCAPLPHEGPPPAQDSDPTEPEVLHVKFGQGHLWVLPVPLGLRRVQSGVRLWVTVWRASPMCCWRRRASRTRSLSLAGWPSALEMRLLRIRKRMKGQRPWHFPAARSKAVAIAHVPVGTPGGPEFVCGNDLGPWAEGLGAHGYQCWKRQPCLWLSLSRGSASRTTDQKTGPEICCWARE